MNRFVKYSFFVALCFLVSFAAGQTRDELEKKRKEKEEEIRFTKNLIEKTSEKQKETLKYLEVLNQQIQSREELIATVREEIQSIRESIKTNNEIMNSLESDLNSLKEEYERMVEFSYKTRSQYDKLVFIFSAEDFNKAYKRLRFLRYYSKFRERQIEMIRKTRASLRGKVKELEKQRSEKRQLLAKERQEKQELEADLEAKSNVVEKLNDKEEQLKAKLAKKKKKAKELESAIERMIEEEMKAKKEEDAKEYANTPEARIESNKFRENKARLPWPVEKGFISSGFGKQPHPTLSGVTVKNDGIHITTSENANARAVFDGEVSKVISQRGGGMAVIVKHGKYFTVYSNLKEAKVTPGDKIEKDQELGIVRTAENTGNAELHFQIYHSFDKLDPQKWLAQK